MSQIETKNGRVVNPIGLGTMPISAFYYPQPESEEAIQLLFEAVRIGYNLIDTAMIYGNGQNGEGEVLLGKALSHCKRENIFVSTKCGLGFDQNGQVVIGCKKNQILSDCNESLKRLETDYIDVLFIHRVDSHTPLKESLDALIELKDTGKIRYIGISEVDSALINKAVLYLDKFSMKLDFIQNEYSLTTRDDEKNEVLDLCERHGINYISYAPLGRGLLADIINKKEKFSEISSQDFRVNCLPRFSDVKNFEDNNQLVYTLESIANSKSSTVSQLSLAWILFQARERNMNIFPIPGTINIMHLKENFDALKLNITAEEANRISKLLPFGAIKGDRWPDELSEFISR